MKIKRKIYWNLCLVALLAMAVSALITALLLCQDLQTQMRQSVMTEVRYLESAMDVSGEEYLAHLKSRGDGNSVNRITWVSPDGAVLYDSFADSESLENHKDRPEIAAALKNGRGESVRTSRTLAEQTYYYAARLDDGSVIRVASTTKSALATVVHTIPVMIAMGILIVVGVLILAEFQTKRIVAPINEMDPDDPKAGEVYDELAPLVRRLEKQNETIRQQMETLREKQEEFTTITENMREGFIVVDSRGDVMSYNKSALKLLGIPVEQADGYGQAGNARAGLQTGTAETHGHAADTGHQANFNIISLNRSENFRQVVDGALKGTHCEQMLDVGNRHYQIIANPVAESNGRSGAVVVILDVTEQQSREELRREFTANVSHELKTPLTSISGNASNLLSNGDMFDAKTKHQMYVDIYDDAMWLINLVENLLSVSRLEGGQMNLHLSTELIGEVVAEALRHINRRSAEHHLHIQSGDEYLLAQMDAHLIVQVIINIVDNAIKYTPPGSDIEISWERQGRFAALSVADNGPGIPDSAKPRVFDMFYSASNRIADSRRSMGLGLALCKSIITAHGGEITVADHAPHGTVFTFTIPIEEVELHE